MDPKLVRSRRTVRVDSGVLRIDQRIRIPRLEFGTDVSGPACIYAQVEVAKGTVEYVCGETHVRAPSRFAIFLPPFAIVQARLTRCDVTSAGVAFRPPRPYALPQRALLIPDGADHPPSSVDEVLDRLRSPADAVDIGRAPAPPLIASKAKAALDAKYAAPVRIGRIAAHIHVSPATLSRTLKEAYGVPPVRYRHQVRIMDALMRFAEGAAPADVFLDVGFDDLSRFYKIFRQVACAPPGSYRRVRSRNAKT